MLARPLEQVAGKQVGLLGGFGRLLHLCCDRESLAGVFLVAEVVVRMAAPVEIAEGGHLALGGVVEAEAGPQREVAGAGELCVLLHPVADLLLLAVGHLGELQLAERVAGQPRVAAVLDDLVDEREDVGVRHLREVELTVVFVGFPLVGGEKAHPAADPAEIPLLLLRGELLVEPLRPGGVVPLVHADVVRGGDLLVVVRRQRRLQLSGPIAVEGVAVILLHVGELALLLDRVADHGPIFGVCGDVGARLPLPPLERLRQHVEVAELLVVGLGADVMGHHLRDRRHRGLGIRRTKLDCHLLVALDPLVGLPLLDEVFGKAVERGGAQLLLHVVGILREVEPRLHRLRHVAALHVALADPVKRRGGILHVVGEEVEHLLVDLHRLEPLLRLLQCAALPQDRVGRDLRLGKLHDEGVVLGDGPGPFPGDEDLVGPVDRDSLKRVELRPLLGREAGFLGPSRTGGEAENECQHEDHSRVTHGAQLPATLGNQA